jgi:hypothetical protein
MFNSLDNRGYLLGCLWEVCKHAGYHYFGVHELQTEELYIQQEQAEQSRPHGVEEVLQILQ